MLFVCLGRHSFILFLRSTLTRNRIQICTDEQQRSNRFLFSKRRRCVCVCHSRLNIVYQIKYLSSNLNLICLFIDKNSLKFQFHLKLIVSLYTICILDTIRSLDERFISSTDVQFVGHKCLYVLKRIMAHIQCHFWHDFGDVSRMNESFSRPWHVLNKWHPTAKTAYNIYSLPRNHPSPPTEKHLQHCHEYLFVGFLLKNHNHTTQTHLEPWKYNVRTSTSWRILWKYYEFFGEIENKIVIVNWSKRILSILTEYSYSIDIATRYADKKKMKNTTRRHTRFICNGFHPQMSDLLHKYLLHWIAPFARKNSIYYFVARL